MASMSRPTLLAGKSSRWKMMVRPKSWPIAGSHPAPAVRPHRRAPPRLQVPVLPQARRRALALRVAVAAPARPHPALVVRRVPLRALPPAAQAHHRVLPVRAAPLPVSPLSHLLRAVEVVAVPRAIFFCSRSQLWRPLGSVPAGLTAVHELKTHDFWRYQPVTNGNHFCEMYFGFTIDQSSLVNLVIHAPTPNHHPRNFVFDLPVVLCLRWRWKQWWSNE